MPQNFLRVESFHQKSTIEHIHTFTRSTFAHDTSGLASVQLLCMKAEQINSRKGSRRNSIHDFCSIFNRLNIPLRVECVRIA